MQARLESSALGHNEASRPSHDLGCCRVVCAELWRIGAPSVDHQICGLGSKERGRGAGLSAGFGVQGATRPAPPSPPSNQCCDPTLAGT